MEFILDYNKWRCGTDGKNQLGKGKTLLLNSEGYMCCLGQWCEQQGINKERLLGNGHPYQLEQKIKAFATMKDREYSNTVLSDRAIAINDDKSTTPAEKIKLLKRLFSKFKHKITVINAPNGIS